MTTVRMPQHKKSRQLLQTAWVALAIMVLTMGALAQSASSAAPDLPTAFDPLKSVHRDLFEPMYGTPFTIGFDQDSVMAFYMGTELAQQPSDTYGNIRYVLLQYEDLSNPTLELQSRGGIEGSGNPSHVIIFGWQDYKNYYYVYAAESPETRVARVVDGVHETLYRHGSVIWVRDRDRYQDLKVSVNTVGDDTVVDTYVNGELVMAYTFGADETPPAGRVGLGGWNGPHSAYFKNIRLSID